jgi:histidine triad (HIT) family protein
VIDPACEFCGVVRGERPARIVGESPETLAFFPLRPVALGHTLVIPKEHVRDLWSPGAPGPQLMQVVRRVGQALTAALRPDGLNLISSAGEAASQTVFHLHLHVIPRWSGDRLGNIWPPSGPLSDGLKDETAAAIRTAYNGTRAESGESENSQS